MNIRYLKAENLMCLLLPKNNVMLPWRGQPTVLFGYSFSEWQRFISTRRDGTIRSYFEIRQLPIEQQKMYFYAEACLAQFYEIAFSGENATNIIATELPMTEDEISEAIAKYATNPDRNIYEYLSRFNTNNREVKFTNSLSLYCLLYCYHKSMEGEYNVWTLK